jgi:hypothetical protein
MVPSFPVLELLQDSEDPPLTPERLHALEAELGLRFPADYAGFLLQHNGGHFRLDVSFYLPKPTK